MPPGHRAEGQALPVHMMVHVSIDVFDDEANGWRSEHASCDATRKSPRGILPENKAPAAYSQPSATINRSSSSLRVPA